jgi:preprotein translocase SecE subunit
VGRDRIRARKKAEREEEEDSSEVSSSSKDRRRGSSRRRTRRRGSGTSSSSSSGSRGAKSNNPVIRYFQETSDELRKVKWPTQEEAIRLTLICLAATAVSTLILGGLDYIAQEVVVFALQMAGGG